LGKTKRRREEIPVARGRNSPVSSSFISEIKKQKGPWGNRKEKAERRNQVACEKSPPSN